jgi:Tfp pilus assembly protein PilF
MHPERPSSTAYETAQTLAASGNYEESIAAYSVAIDDSKNDPKAYIGRGLAFQRLGHHIKAVIDFDEVISFFSEWPSVWIAFYGRAVSRHTLGNFENAIDDCNTVVSLNPNHADTFYLRGIIQKSLNRIEEALKDMDRVLQVDANYWEAFRERGKLLLLQNPERAIADFTSALESEYFGINRGELLLFRGIAEQSTGDHRAAIKDFSDAIELAPSVSTSYLRRSRSYSEIGEVKLAVDDLQIGMRLSKKTAGQ